MALTNPESCNKHYSNWYRHIVIAGCMPFLTAVVFLFHLYHPQAGLASIAHPLRHGFHKNLSCIQNTRVGTLWLNHTTFKATLNYLQHFDFVWLEKKTIPSKLKPTKYSIWQPALSIPTLAQRLSCCLAQSWQSTANQTNPGAMHGLLPELMLLLDGRPWGWKHKKPVIVTISSMKHSETGLLSYWKKKAKKKNKKGGKLEMYGNVLIISCIIETSCWKKYQSIIVKPSYRPTKTCLHIVSLRSHVWASPTPGPGWSSPSFSTNLANIGWETCSTKKGQGWSRCEHITWDGMLENG